MREKLSTNDAFIEFRDENNTWWKNMEPIIKDIFPNKEIPSMFKDHLVELVVMRDQEGADRLMSFMGEHDQLFDDKNFAKAVTIISERMGAALVEVKSDSWVK